MAVPLATSALYALAGLGLGGGGLYGLSQLNKKKPQAQFTQFDPYAQQRQQLYARLGELVNQEVPEIFKRGSELFRRDIVPQIQETFQAKRRLGVGSTPEVSALGQAGASLTDRLAEAAALYRLNAARLQMGLLGEPVTTVEQPEPTALQNLLSFGVPALSGYLQSQAIQRQLEDIKPVLDLFRT